jgi:hypothetical protein
MAYRWKSKGSGVHPLIQGNQLPLTFLVAMATKTGSTGLLGKPEQSPNL